jgi:hypothetical protein
MRPARGVAVVVALCAAAAAGCGLGAGDDAGEAELAVSRDYGADVLVRESDRISESDTVLRLLDRRAEVETRYGGGFVQSIDGLAGGSEGGRRFDWLFFVNGIEAPRGAAEFELRDGDRVWWDFRDWTAAMRAPAVVGSFPEPFAHGFDGESWPAAVVCLARVRTCELARSGLAEAGVEAELVDGLDRAPDGVLRVLVGSWDRVAEDRVAALLGTGPSRSGVFARFEGSGDATRLVLLDQRAAVATAGGAEWGLVAALRPGEGPPTWVVTGTGDRGGLALAARALNEETLRDRFAVALSPGGEPVALPLQPEGGA